MGTKNLKYKISCNILSWYNIKNAFFFLCKSLSLQEIKFLELDKIGDPNFKRYEKGSLHFISRLDDYMGELFLY